MLFKFDLLNEFVYCKNMRRLIPNILKIVILSGEQLNVKK